MKIAEIFLNQKNYRLDKPYEYKVPEDARPGQRVKVPFGKGNRSLEGFIVSVKDQPEYQGEIREIKYLIDKDPILSPEQIKLCFFIKERAFCLFYDALSNFTTGVKTRTAGGKSVAYEIKDISYYVLKNEKKVRGSKQIAVIEYLKDTGKASYPELKKKIPGLTKATINRLIELEIIEEEKTTPEELLPFRQIKFNRELEANNKETEQTENKYLRTTDKDKFFRVIQKDLFISQDSQTVVIFPDSYSARNFSEFLEDKYGIENSLYLTRYDQHDKHLFYRHVKDGSIRIVVGTSPALFLPFKNLNSVVVANVGDESYTQSLTANFNAVETAEKLAELWGASFLAQDIMDSVLARQKIKDGEWEVIEEEDVDIQEIKSEDILHLINKKKNHAVSDVLYKSILRNLKEKKRTVLLLNRKGYYNLHYCLACGEPLICPDCGGNLKSIRSGKEVSCRICGYQADFPEKCPKCGSRHIEESRFGIEKVAEQLREIFPEAKIEMFFHGHIPKNRNADIIIGTKSLMYLPVFDKVATVAALLVNLDLYYPDYRASEDAFRLYNDFFLRYPEAEHIVQVRGKTQDFLTALEGKTKSFFHDLELYRRSVRLPPYADLYTITLFGDDQKALTRESEILHDRIEAITKDLGYKIRIMPVYKIRGENKKMQRRFVVRADKESGFSGLLEQLYNEGEIEALTSKVSIMVNPANYS